MQIHKKIFYSKEVNNLSNANFTKLMITQGLKSLLETKPFSDISVGDISKQCNISRNTFYYHFKDKFDLINWIFHTEITPIIEKTTDIEHWNDGLLSLCQYMQTNRTFYMNVLEFQGQNSFSECLMDFYQHFISSIISTAQQKDILSQDQISQIARFYAHGLTGAILDWAKEGMISDPKPTVEMLQKLLEGAILKQLLASKEKSTT